AGPALFSWSRWAGAGRPRTQVALRRDRPIEPAAPVRPYAMAACHSAPHAPLRAAPTAATVKNATAPADSEPVTARCKVSRCRPRSAPVTTAPAAPATPHGACDSAAPATV